MLMKLTLKVDFANIYLHMRWEALFDEHSLANLVNGTQNSAKFEAHLKWQNVAEIEWQFFFQAQFFAWRTKSGEINPWNKIVFHLSPSSTLCDVTKVNYLKNSKKIILPLPCWFHCNAFWIDVILRPQIGFQWNQMNNNCSFKLHFPLQTVIKLCTTF